MDKDKKALLAEAKEISKQTECAIVYCNSQNPREWFTSKNLALLSEKNDASKVETFDCTATTPKEEVSVKYKVTKEDLEKFPTMAVAKIKVGNEIDFNPNEISADQLNLLLDKKK